MPVTKDTFSTAMRNARDVPKGATLANSLTNVTDANPSSPWLKVKTLLTASLNAIMDHSGKLFLKMKTSFLTGLEWKTGLL